MKIYNDRVLTFVSSQINIADKNYSEAEKYTIKMTLLRPLLGLTILNRPVNFDISNILIVENMLGDIQCNKKNWRDHMKLPTFQNRHQKRQGMG
jgi:hypothetical protein